MNRQFLQMIPAVGYKAYYLDEEFNLLMAPVICWALCSYYCEEHEEESTTMEPCVLSPDFNMLVPVDDEFEFLVGVFEDSIDKDTLNFKIEELKAAIRTAQSNTETPKLEVN